MFKRVFLSVLMFIILITGVPVYANQVNNEQKIDELEEKYNVILEYDDVNIFTEDDFIDLEKKLIEVDNLKETLELRYHQRLFELRNNNDDDDENEIIENSKARLIRYGASAITGGAPTFTTIQVKFTGTTSIISSLGYTIWTGGSISSKVIGGNGKWRETDNYYELIDGRRTALVSAIGNLSQTYFNGKQYVTVTSEGWRIWFEAYAN